MNTVVIKEVRMFIKQMLGLDFLALVLLLFCAFKYDINSDYCNYSAIIFGVLLGVTVASMFAYRFFVLPYFQSNRGN